MKGKKASTHIKLSSQEKEWEGLYEKVLGYVAAFRQEGEAIDAVRKEAGVKELKAFREGWKKWKRKRRAKLLLMKMRKEYVRAVMEVPIYHKRVRLDRLEEIYHKTEDEKVKIRALEEARKEVEGEGVNIAVMQFYGMSDEELEERRKRILERLKKLSGRVNLEELRVKWRQEAQEVEFREVTDAQA